MSQHDTALAQGSAPVPRRSALRRRGIQATLASLVALGGGAAAYVLTSGVSGASPTTPGPSGPVHFSTHGAGTPPTAAGIVASVNGSSASGACGTGTSGTFTLKTHSGTTDTVTVTSSTTFAGPPNATVSFAEVCVGSHAGVTGTLSGSTIAATSIRIGGPGGRFGGFGGTPPAAAGTVASVGGSSTSGACGTGTSGTFTLKTHSGTTDTVTVTSSTTFPAPPNQSESFAKVCVGDQVAVSGTLSGSTITATSVHIGGPGRPGRPGGPGGFGGFGGTPPAAAGTVASVGGSSTSGACGTGTSGTFTLKTHSGTTDTVTVTSSTTFPAPPNQSESFAKVCVGDQVAVSGTLSGSTITATKVLVGFMGGPRRFGHGGFGPGFARAGAGASGTQSGGSEA